MMNWLRKSSLGRRVMWVSTLVVGGTLMASAPAWAANRTYHIGSGSSACTVVISEPVYHNAGRDDRWFDANGHFTCASKTTITMTTALISGTAQLTYKDLTFKNVTTGSWTISLACDMSLKYHEDIYVGQKVRFDSSKGPWLLGGTTQPNHGVCGFGLPF